MMMPNRMKMMRTSHCDIMPGAGLYFSVTELFVLSDKLLPKLPKYLEIVFSTIIEDAGLYFGISDIGIVYVESLQLFVGHIVMPLMYSLSCCCFSISCLLILTAGVRSTLRFTL